MTLKRSLARLYEAHAAQLVACAWGILRDHSLAEDAVHTGMAKLLTLCDEPRDLKMYVFRSVRNAAIDLQRKRQRRREADSEWVESAPAEDRQTPATGQDEVEQALAQLDSSSREVIHLHLHAEQTFREIASITQQPIGTVASKYRRALNKLRTLLEIESGRD